MELKDLVIGVHGIRNQTYGQYGVLSDFSHGLLKAFKKTGVQAYWTDECINKGLRPNFTIGFNLVCMQVWETLLKANIPNIMWTIDSIFYANYHILKQYSQYRNFILFTFTNGDTEPLSDFYPNTPFAYVATATDPEFWKKKENIKKEYDIVLLSSILDYQEELNQLKKEVSKNDYELMMNMYEYFMQNPHESLYRVYKNFANEGFCKFGPDEYHFIFKKIAKIVMLAKKAQAVEHLKDFNLKVWGNGPWEKYIKGKAKYMGCGSTKESTEIMRKTKIALHPHYPAYEYAMHDRPLNASAVGTFVLSSEANHLESVYGDTAAFYNNANFDNLAELAEYYLKNEDEREAKAQEARKIVLENHTWDARVNQILKIMGF